MTVSAAVPAVPAAAVAAAVVEVPAAVYRLDRAQLSATRKKVEALNARAVRKGLEGEPVRVESVPVEVTESDPRTGLSRTRVEYRVTIVGGSLAYGGWEFLATLDWDPNAGMIVKSMPGGPVAVEREGLRKGWCDHCNAVRARRVTYVLRETATGRQIQVGRSCVKDFLGWAPTPAFLESREPGEQWWGGPGSAEFTPLTVLSYAWALIREHGFVPTSVRDGVCTRDMVTWALYPDGRDAEQRRFAEAIRPLAAEAQQRAGEILAWVRSGEFTGGGDYVANLKAVARGERVTPDHLGLLVSAPQAYARYLERTLVRRRPGGGDGHVSEWVGVAPAAWQGVKGTRLTLDVTVQSVRYISGFYGTSTLYLLTDGVGNVMKWFASGDVLGDRAGARFTIKGTVKAHEEWHGTRQTVLTRCAVVAELEPVAGSEADGGAADAVLDAADGVAPVPDATPGIGVDDALAAPCTARTAAEGVRVDPVAVPVVAGRQTPAEGRQGAGAGTRVCAG